MNYTTNFNLNKPEGTDLYNHLTIDNPNMDIIDGAMQANKLASVGNATELVSGTVHAITRSDSNQNIFKFKATGDFKAGDTITVDGVSVSAFTTGGQPLVNDAYVLSAEVICVLDGTSLWVLVNAIPMADDVAYDSNNSVKQEIDKLKTWTALGEKAFNTNQFLNAAYSEFKFEANIENDLTVIIPFSACREELNAHNKSYRVGFYASSGNSCAAVFQTTKSGDDLYIKLVSFVFGETAYNNAVLRTYAK